MTALWTAEAVVAATGGETAGGWVASGVSIDTRTIAPGDLFVALIGPNRDAHDFVATALDKGAAAALVSRVPEGADPARLVLVPDTQIALEGLGRAGRARSAARIAGVTGSVGKTGTKEALRHVLSRQAPTHASAASHNNHWGVPLSLARLPERASYGVLELGMNHPGELRALTRMVRPHVAIITTVAPAHLAFFPSVEAIADAKSEILEGLEPGGVAVLNRDSEHYPRMRRHAERSPAGRIVTFGQHEAADWRLENVELGPGHSEVTVSIRKQHRLAYRLGPPGRHWVLNSLGVLAVVEALGADVARAARALADLRPPAGRGERQQVRLPGGGEVLLLDESYNANPASMRAAIELLGQMPGRRIAALGDMLELGEHSAALHAALAEPILAAGIDLVLTCGPQMAHLHAALPAERRGAHESDSTSLAAAVKEALRPGDTLLVKGSLGSRMARIIDALQAEEKPTVSRAAL
ncbi:UDP-N-acetylmuramoylalanyl-D-glutamyl-2,6-diaminopimelate--D-alanyl-D-alanine ligase [Benzoatithermus flavus]|uniref:UDP-N-acetylmuramoyl-tripeptide--D-alanyl-D-alanine ligase n=1 Tax=Benzoatithermus flavus TaxID=3108223 RepID=A0ABU8XNC6_9PROT